MIVVLISPPLFHFSFVLYPQEVVEESRLGEVRGGWGGIKREINSRREGGKEKEKGKWEKVGRRLRGGRGGEKDEEGEGKEKRAEKH